MTAESEHSSPSSDASYRHFVTWITQARIWVVLLIITVAGTIESHGEFVHLSNVVNLFFLATPIGLAALGETIVILTAGIDLSLASTGILAAVVSGLIANGGGNPWVALLAGMLVGLAVGAANGVLVTWLKVPALIATLGMLVVGEGLARTMTANAPILSLAAGYRDLGTAAVEGMPAVTIAWILLSLLAAWVLSRTEWGKTVYAAGSNLKAAFYSGLRVKRTLFLAYCIAGILAALAGSMQSAYLNIATPNVDYNQLFEIIAGAVVGGASLFGGEGGVMNTVGGVLVIMAIQNVLLLMGVSALIMQGVVGIIIVLAVWINLRLKRESSRVDHKGI